MTGTEALVAGAVAMRDFVRKHPGRYTAANTATLGGQDDPLRAASARVMAAWATMLEGYHLDHGEQIHAQRMLRSMLHGFATIEASGGFQIDTPVEDSFTWIIDFMDHACAAQRVFPSPLPSPVPSPDAAPRKGARGRCRWVVDVRLLHQRSHIPESLSTPSVRTDALRS